MINLKEKWIAIPGLVRLNPSDKKIFRDGLWNILPEDDVERLPICTVDYADDHDEATRKSAEEIAHLIAATPELLEACKEALNALLDYVDTLEKQGCMMNYGRKVIAQLYAALLKSGVKV